MDQASIKMSRQEARRFLADLASMLKGRKPDPSGGLVAGLYQEIGAVLAGIFRESFWIKAGGGVDAAGIRWIPRKEDVVSGAGPVLGVVRRHNVVTKKQQKRWNDLYQSLGARGKTAAAAAWLMLRAEGRGRLAQGQRLRGPIGVSTGLMAKSFVSDASGLDQAKPTITVKNTAPYARFFHKTRPLWPSASAFPEIWRVEIGRSFRESMVRLVERLKGAWR